MTGSHTLDSLCMSLPFQSKTKAERRGYKWEEVISRHRSGAMCVYSLRCRRTDTGLHSSQVAPAHVLTCASLHTKEAPGPEKQQHGRHTGESGSTNNWGSSGPCLGLKEAIDHL